MMFVNLSFFLCARLAAAAPLTGGKMLRFAPHFNLTGLTGPPDAAFTPLGGQMGGVGGEGSEAAGSPHSFTANHIYGLRPLKGLSAHEAAGSVRSPSW